MTGAPRAVWPSWQKLTGLKAASTQGIISILRSEVETFDLAAQSQEIGVVQSVGDGIAVMTALTTPPTARSSSSTAA